MPVIIDDPDDPRIAVFRSIKERDLRGRRGLFIAEGKVVMERLARSSLFMPVNVLVAETRLEAVLRMFGAFGDDVPIHVCAQEIFDHIAGFPVHRGLLAACRHREPPVSAEMLLQSLKSRQTLLVLAASAIANHDNMGALFRNAAAFGVAAVLLDDQCCDPLYRKAIRVSVGAVLDVPYAFAGSCSSLVDDLRKYGVEPFSLTPSGRTDIDDARFPDRAALLVGSEGEGLAPGILQRTQTLSIPMENGFDSLNVATSAAIALHRLRSAQTMKKSNAL